MSRLHVALVCFASYGGSGVVASEIALAMAARGHRVRVIGRERPERLRGGAADVAFDRAQDSDYPALAEGGAYPIALAAKIVEVARAERVDVLHVHYAVPHATAAFVARAVLGPAAPRIVTTLHGTDVTIVGADAGFQPVVRHAVAQSDAVTAPSEFLRAAARARLRLGDDVPVEVVPNFVDATRFAPSRDRAALRGVFPDLADDEAVLIHVSNLRPVKRVPDVVRVFAAVAARRPARLVVVGDGPERTAAERLVDDLGLRARAAFLGKQGDFRDVLAASDVFLLPSETESFGLAALEAQSCGVPVVAAATGGVAEVIVDGETGLLAPVGDVDGMAARATSLVEDRAKWAAFSAAARRRVLERFDEGPAIDRYEAIYRRVLDG